MKRFALITNNKTYIDCWFELQRYVADNSLAIIIKNDFGAIAKITVCLEGSYAQGVNLANDSSFVDSNNYPWAVGFLERNGFGKRTGISIGSGYCQYPLVKFDIKKLQEYSENYDDNGDMVKGGAQNETI